MKGSKNAPENRGAKNLAVMCGTCHTKVTNTLVIKGGKKKFVKMCDCKLSSPAVNLVRTLINIAGAIPMPKAGL